MIIASELLLEINKIYSEKDFNNEPFSYGDDMHFKYTFQVLRKATLNEYKEYAISIFGEWYLEPNWIYFYEISID